MKQRLLLLPILTLFVSLFSACQPEPSGPNGWQALNISTSPAHPALTYYGIVKSDAGPLTAIGVMDTNGRNQTAIFVAPSVNIDLVAPCWSPTGGAICFTQCGMGVVPDTIKAIDVSLSNSASPIKRNVRTIVGLASPGSIHGSPGAATLGYAFWSSTSAFGKIAYTTTNEDKISLCVVPEIGGSSVIVWTGRAWEGYAYCAWSPDDSRLAFCRFDPSLDQFETDRNTIMIFNTSDWSCEDSIQVTGRICGLAWSHSGLNKLVFARAGSLSSPYCLYYCDPKTGATPTTNGVIGELPSWAPDNSSILCYNNGLTKVTPFTRFATVIDSSLLKSVVMWRR